MILMKNVETILDEIENFLDNIEKKNSQKNLPKKKVDQTSFFPTSFSTNLLSD